MVIGAGIANPNPSPLTIEGIVAAAHRVHPGNPVMAQLAAAQAVLESGIGTGRVSRLARDANNLFGIKGTGDAGSVTMRTREVRGGVSGMEDAQFAAFSTPEGSLLRHAELMGRDRYRAVASAQTFEEAARAVQAAGYATDPNYANALIRIQQTMIHSASQQYLISSPYYNPIALEPHVLSALETASDGAHREAVGSIRELLAGNGAQRIEGLQALSALNRRLLVEAGVAPNEREIPQATFHLAQKLGAPLAAAIHRAPDANVPVVQLEPNAARREAVQSALQAYVLESSAILTEESVGRMNLPPQERARLNQILGRRTTTPPAGAAAAPAATATTPPADGATTPPAATAAASPTEPALPLEASELTAADLRLLSRARSGEHDQRIEAARTRVRTDRRRPDGTPMSDAEVRSEDNAFSQMMSQMGQMGMGGMLIMMLLFLFAPGLMQGMMGGGQQQGEPAQGTPPAPSTTPTPAASPQSPATGRPATPPASSGAPTPPPAPAAPGDQTSLQRSGQFAALLAGQDMHAASFDVSSIAGGETTTPSGARGPVSSLRLG